ncbi:MAG TPA: permease-like cell division protein FtsX, partial [Burkholderiales bacterium]|nr:permease-like cell division protein FtsX [Burkholderiales bacterium]
MKHWLAHHARTCGATLARLIRTPLATLLNASVIGVALALPVGFHLALVNIQTFAGNLASAPQLSLFLSREAQPQDVAQIRAQLEKHTGIRHYRFVPRDEALRS